MDASLMLMTLAAALAQIAHRRRFDAPDRASFYAQKAVQFGAAAVACFVVVKAIPR